MPSNNNRNSRDDKSRSTRSAFSKNPAKNEKPASRSGRSRTERGDEASTKRDNSFPKREGSFSREGAPKREGSFKKRESSYKPDGKFAKRDDKFPKRDDKFAKRDGKFTKRDDKFAKRDGSSPREEGSFKKPYYGKHRERKESASRPTHADKGLIRLNRYVANAGICSRRKADELIEAGVVSVNGQVVTELGIKVDPAKDEVRYNGERLKREKMVYVLLNKPKDFITTTDDPQDRRTVMDLVAKATNERIYPIGRLDRNTTGLLLLTNDGNLSEKLSHPRNRVSKLYYVELDKNLTQGDLNKIAFGLELEDGLVKPDDVSYVQGSSKREVGIQIHSGKNRIVRRIFEHLGYDVIKLDRVVYANLTKKDLPRGHWRYLEEREIIQLKNMIK